MAPPAGGWPEGVLVAPSELVQLRRLTSASPCTTSLVVEPDSGWLIRPLREAANDIKPVFRCINGKESVQCVFVPRRPTKKLHWPLGDSFLSDMTIFAHFRFVDVFPLKHQG